MRLEHRTNAAEQGMAAARNLLHGDTTPFAPLPYFWTDQYDVKIQAHGVLSEGSEVSIEQGSVGEDRFVAVYRDGGRVIGVVGWKAPTLVLPYRRRMLEETAATAS
jgi:hypothetical protein